MVGRSTSTAAQGAGPLGRIFDIDDRTVLVTGASSGIGRGLAVGLASVGASVYAADISAFELDESEDLAVRQGGGRVEPVLCDVTDEDAVNATFKRVAEETGRLDAVFSNAGIAGTPTPTDDLSLEDWRDVLRVNLDGAFLVARSAIGLMKPAGGGKIIFTSSTWGMVGTPQASLAAYAASKGGVVNLVRQLAVELAPFNITVNGIAPSAIRSSIAGGFYDDEEAVAGLLEGIPLGRVVDPLELVGLAIYMSSSPSDFMTGHTIVFDGGFLAH